MLLAEGGHFGGSSAGQEHGGTGESGGSVTAGHVHHMSAMGPQIMMSLAEIQQRLLANEMEMKRMSSSQEQLASDIRFLIGDTSSEMPPSMSIRSGYGMQSESGTQSHERENADDNDLDSMPSVKSSVKSKKGRDGEHRLSSSSAPPTPQPRGRLSSLLGRALYSTYFDYVMALTLAVNTLVIAFETDYKVRNIGAESPMVYDVFSWLFTVLFSVEIMVRLIVEKCYFFIGPNKMWNAFDSTLVIASCVEKLDTTMSHAPVVNVLKTCRVLKLFRVMRFVPDLRKMFMGIVATVASLFWAMVLLGMIILVFAIAITSYVTMLLEEGELSESIKEMFGDMITSIFSLFKAMSGGIDWGDLSDPIVAVRPYFFLVFAMYISLILYCVMNVVTAVFVDNSNKLCDEEDKKVEAKVRQELKNFMDETDRDGSGTMSYLEWEQACMNEKVKSLLCAIDIDVDQIGAKRLFDIIDRDDNELIDKQEFVTAIFSLRGAARAIDMYSMRHDLCRLDNKLTMTLRQSRLLAARMAMAIGRGDEDTSHMHGQFKRSTGREILKVPPTEKEKKQSLATYSLLDDNDSPKKEADWTTINSRASKSTPVVPNERPASPASRSLKARRESKAKRSKSGEFAKDETE
eukprot:TRINITY_DN30325_c0_g1_i1.p1 TRINITY_DN30325_c0_g1~~TRINITY_DN30325_c0_g1_i1.p1  ORF type:complete len:632 (+),score=129.35 TRINITY_DN30325_c0_g1_i1:195-2090(+)